MQDQEVADALELELSLRVVGLLQNWIEIAARKEVHQPEDPRLGEEYGGRLERLEEAAGEPDRDDVLIPELLALAGREADRLARIGERLAIEPLEERGARLVVADEA